MRGLAQGKIESNKLETLEWSKEDDEPSCDNINGQSNQEINDGEIESDHGSDEETATIEVNAAITRSKALLNKDIRNSELGKPQKEKKNKEAMRKLLNAERQKLALSRNEPKQNSQLNKTVSLRELNLLEERDPIVEDKILEDYVESTESRGGTMQPVQLEEVRKESPTDQPQATQPTISQVNRGMNVKPKVRRKRQSQYFVQDKEKLFQHLEDNTTLNLKVADLYALSPEYLSHVHKKTKSKLVSPESTEIPVVSNKLLLVQTEDESTLDTDNSGVGSSDLEYDVEEGEMLETLNAVINYPDSSVSKPLLVFPVTIGGKEFKAKYDPGSNSNLINPRAVKELKLKVYPISASIRGINPGLKQINGMVKVDLSVNNFKLAATLLIHEDLEDNCILVGRLFQEDHCFLIGYLTSINYKELSFKHNNELKKFNLVDGNILAIQNNEEPDLELEELLKIPLQDSMLNEEQKKYLLNKLRPIKLVFENNNGEVGMLRHFPPVKIETEPHEPWISKTLPLGSKKDAAVQLLSNMLKNGQIEYASESTYSNPWFLVEKLNKKFRMLVDLRQLNLVVKLMSGHPRLVEESIGNIAGRTCLSTLDISNAYFQVPVDEGSRNLTSFQTPLGVMRFCVLPQGFANSVALFVNILGKILSPVAQDVETFVDDICVMSEYNTSLVLKDTIIKNHLDKLVQTLDLLNYHGLKINPLKVQLAKAEVDFLGYRVGPQGATLLRKKVEAFREFPLPSTVSKLERFIGMVNYYRRTIPAFSEICSPLHKLVTNARKQGVRSVKLTEDDKKRFEYLKKCLVSEPLVAPLLPEDDVCLFTDASISTWAGVLQTHNEAGDIKVVDCVSGIFTGPQVNYSIYEKEMLAITLALTKLSMHLLNYKKIIKVYCDNKAVVTLLTGPFSNGHLVNRVAKWLNILRNYHLKIAHVSGTVNVVADSLSRVNDPDAAPLLSIPLQNEIKEFKSKLELQSNVLQVNENDPKFGKFSLLGIQHYLLTLEVPLVYEETDKLRKAFLDKANQFFMNEGKMYKIGNKGHFARPVITDPNEVKKILKMTHDDRGHMKTNNLFDYLNLLFFIPNLYQTVKEYIASCHTCQIYDGNNTGRDPLSLNLPGGLFDTIVCDSVYIEDHWLVVVRDEFSNWAEATVMVDLDGGKIADFIYRDVICRFGQFRVLKSDNGTEWKNGFVDKLLNYYNVAHTYSTPFHPQGNGKIERNHVGLVNFLKKLPKDLDWKDYVPAALRVDRNMIKSTTGMSPHYLVYGYCGHSDLSLLYINPPENKLYTDDELFKFRFKQLQFREVQYNSAMKQTEMQRLRSKEYFDAKHEIDTPVTVGDLVLIWDRPYKNPMGPKMKKMQPKWSGPFKVKSMNDRTYKLEELNGIELSRSFTREMMKLYIKRD